MAPPAFRGRWPPTADQTSLSLKKRATEGQHAVRFHRSPVELHLGRRLAAVWDAADDIDLYRTGWTYDHFYPLRTGPEEPTLEGWTGAGHAPGPHPAAARRGARQRRPVPAPGGAGQHGRHGRHRLGRPPGAGDRRRWFEAECEAYGIELGSITERFDRFEESLAVTHSLLTEPTTTFSGRYHRSPARYREPKATQIPPPAVRARRQG